jgi:SpoVK/Ycf46/Vps4 family AAA+-type ATPase
MPRQESSEAPTSGLYELIEQPTARWEDLIIPDVLKSRLQRNLSVLRHRETLLAWGFGDIPGYENRMAVALNLVGPSGTGKSFSAQVIAHELGRPLMVVDYAQLESKYVGDTSKNIRSVFSDARSRGDCVLFFDEADSFLGRRSEDVRQSYDTAVNSTRAVMLMELQSFQGVVLFATNLIKNYDPAFRRRIIDHIEFPLPDAQARARILDSHTPKNIPGRADLNFVRLGEFSDSLSGGELANVAYQASLGLLAQLDSPADLPEAELTVSDDDFITAIRSVQRAQEMLPDRIPQSPSLRQVIMNDKSVTPEPASRPEPGDVAPPNKISCPVAAS